MKKHLYTDKTGHERFRSELLDQMLFFQEDNNDHQIRGVISFDGIIDRECMSKAVLQSIKSIPILGCRFVETDARSYWERLPEPIADEQAITFIDADNLADAIAGFLSKKTDEMRGPQITASIIRSASKDTLCIVMNHMAFDGAGFKEYLYLLGHLYTGLKKNRDYQHEHIFNDDRGLGQILKEFSATQKVRFALAANKSVGKGNNLSFPRASKGNLEPIFVSCKLPRERFNALKAYGKEHGVTVNDMILASYYRALYRMIGPQDGKSLHIPCMVDLRRYRRKNTPAGFCNLSSMIGTTMEATPDFDEAVKKTHGMMISKKKGLPGLNAFAMLLLIFGILPYGRFKRFIKSKFQYPSITITNLGIIDSQRLKFGDNAVNEAAIFAALKYPPFFQLTFSTFSDSITFTVSLYGLEKDRKTIDQFFSLLEADLP